MLNINIWLGRLKDAIQEGWGQLGGSIFRGGCTGKYLSFPNFPAAMIGVARAGPTVPDGAVKSKGQHEESAADVGKRFLIQSVALGQNGSGTCVRICVVSTHGYRLFSGLCFCSRIQNFEE